MASVRASDGVLALGLVFLLISGYGLYSLATANYGASYLITAVEPVEHAADPTKVIDYSHLPTAAQASFDVAQQGAKGDPIWESEDPEAVRSIRAHSYVRKDGQLFQYSLIHGDHIGPGLFGVVLLLLFGIAGLLLVRHSIDKRYDLDLPN